MELTVIYLSCNIFSLKEQGQGLNATLCGDWLQYTMCTDDMSQPHHISFRWISGICIEVQVPMGRIDLPYFQLRRSSCSGGTGLVKLMVKILNAEEKEYWKRTAWTFYCMQYEFLHALIRFWWEVNYVEHYHYLKTVSDRDWWSWLSSITNQKQR